MQFTENKEHIGELFTPEYTCDKLVKLALEYFNGYTFIEPCAGCGNILKSFEKFKVNYKAFDLYESNVKIVNSRGFKCVQRDFFDLNPNDFKKSVIVTNPPYELKQKSMIYRKEIYKQFMKHFDILPQVILIPFRDFVTGEMGEFMNSIVYIELLPPHLFNARIMGETCIIVRIPENKNKTIKLVFPGETPGNCNVHFRKLSLPPVNSWKPWETFSIEINKVTNSGLPAVNLPFLRDYNNYSSLEMLFERTKSFPRLSETIEIVSNIYFLNISVFDSKLLLVKKGDIPETHCKVIVSRLVSNRKAIASIGYENYENYMYIIDKSILKNQPFDYNIIITPATNEAWNGFYRPIKFEILEKNTVFTRSYIGIKCNDIHKMLNYLQSKLFACLVSTVKASQNFSRKQFELLPDLSEHPEMIQELMESELIKNWPEEQRHSYNKSKLSK